MNNFPRTFLFLCLIALFFTAALADETLPETDPSLVGDIGFGTDYAPSIARSRSSDYRPIPYVNAEYGRFFGRIDTFGYGVMPVGYGALELVTRVIDDGYTPATTTGNLAQRKSSIPVGFGTLQTMPGGAVLFNIYHDFNQSRGNLADLLFAEELDGDHVAFYPQIGAEYRSENYVRYFYGVSPAQAGPAKLTSYRPGGATNLFVDLFFEVNIAGHWYANANFRKTWLDKSISASPLVGQHDINSGLIALSYRFE